MGAFPLDKWRTFQLGILDPRLSTLSKVVFARLMEHHNTKMGQCNPTVGRLARDLSRSERSVRTSIRQLEKNKYIKTTRKPGLRGRNFYRLSIPIGKKEYERAAKLRPYMGKKTSGKPMKEPKKEPLGIRKAEETYSPDVIVTLDPTEVAEKNRAALETEVVRQLGNTALAWEKLQSLEPSELDYPTSGTVSDAVAISERAEALILMYELKS